jgi:tetrahydromethanopterin S-methyltransferase subunit G
MAEDNNDNIKKQLDRIEKKLKDLEGLKGKRD